MEKFEFLDETMKLLGLSRQEVIDYWNNTQCKSEKNQLIFVYAFVCVIGTGNSS